MSYSSIQIEKAIKKALAAKTNLIICNDLLLSVEDVIRLGSAGRTLAEIDAKFPECTNATRRMIALSEKLNFTTTFATHDLPISAKFKTMVEPLKILYQ